MTKRNYISLTLILFINICSGQFVGRDNLSMSLFYMQKQELDSAKKYIDLSMTNDSLIKNAKAWYYKGFIYKELYKNKNKSDKKSPYRITAIKSLTKVLELDIKKDFTESSTKILNYLASTLYNDAARSLNPNDYEVAKTNYNNYRKIILLIDTNAASKLKIQDIKFKLALASMLNKAIENNQISNPDNTHKMIINLFLDILKIDAENPPANYNLAISYYNKAAETINNMDYDMDIEKLNEVQDYCIEIFLKALPYMRKAYKLNYKKKETLIGLSNIYYGLNDITESEKFKKELQLIEIQEKLKKLNEELQEMNKNGMQNSEKYKTHKMEIQTLENMIKDLDNVE